MPRTRRWFDSDFFEIPGIDGSLNLIFSKYPPKKRWVFEKSKNNTTLSSFLWSFLRWWIGNSGFLCLGLSEMKCYCTVKEAKYSTTAENMSLYIGYPSISIYEGRLFVCFVLFVQMKSTQLRGFR
jgi:hypothetical protein